MLDCIIDVSHFSGLHLDFQAAKADGILVCIHKSTQGTRYFDPRYIANRQAALDAGLLFAAYHFGTGLASGKDQAEFILTRTEQGTRLVLDFEPNRAGLTMGINQAIEFCETVETFTKLPAIIYTGLPMMPQVMKLRDTTLYGERLLWWAEYNNPPRHAPKDWPLTLHQYTDHAFVEGIGHCDKSEFYGSPEALTKLFTPEVTP